jgi:hypothetical protein
MMENEFRSLAPAQGLPPSMRPPNLHPHADPSSGPDEDNPAMAEQHTSNA